MRVRFPYPLPTQLALVAIVLFAVGHTIYTNREVAELMKAAGGTGGEGRTYVIAMYAMTMTLAAFVAFVLAYRSRLALWLRDDALVFKRLHVSRAKREMVFPWAEVTRVAARPDVRGTWHLYLEVSTFARRFPLAHATIVGEGKSERPPVRDGADVRKHPLLVALTERLGEERVKIE